MKNRNVPGCAWNHPGRLRLLLNLFFVLLMLLTAFGSAAAADATPPAAGRTAADPYDQWSGDFLDFVPPNPDTLQLAQPDGTPSGQPDADGNRRAAGDAGRLHHRPG